MSELIEQWGEWVGRHGPWIKWLAAFSVVTFVGTLLAIPIMVARIPTDYFTTRTRHPSPWRNQHPIVRFAALLAKNLLGLVFIAAGMAMWILPGQGMITMMIGIILLDLPGKFRFERWLIRRRSISRAINWVRRKVNSPPLLIPEDGEDRSTDQ
jgi:hypothetical protein